MAGLNSSQDAWSFSRASHPILDVPGLWYLPISHDLDAALPSSYTQYYNRATIESNFHIIPHWCGPCKMFPYPVSNSLPLLGWNSVDDISRPQQDFHPGNVPTRQQVMPVYHDVSPLQTQFQTSGIGPRPEDSISNESYWSSNLPSSIMREDNSILSFQAGSERQQDISGQLRVDTCDTVSVLLSRRHSVFTQTETPRRADAHLNTEVSMADLDCLEENPTPVKRLSLFTQTEAPGTADAHLNTEVTNADLVYLTEVFIKLKETNEELRKKNMALRRAYKKESQQAELSLLALHYSMCRMHCSGLCSNSQESQSITTTSERPQANMAGVLHKLESDYNQMRQEILSGVRLKQLEPLSVDLQGGSSEGSYIPSQIPADLPENVQSGNSLEQDKSPDGEKGCVELKSENGKQRSVLTAACSDPSVSEAWYDAEEYFDDLTCGGAQRSSQCVSSKTTEIGKKAHMEKCRDTDSSACSENRPVPLTTRHTFL